MRVKNANLKAQGMDDDTPGPRALRRGVRLTITVRREASNNSICRGNITDCRVIKDIREKKEHETVRLETIWDIGGYEMNETKNCRVEKNGADEQWFCKARP